MIQRTLGARHLSWLPSRAKFLVGETRPIGTRRKYAGSSDMRSRIRTHMSEPGHVRALGLRPSTRHSIDQTCEVRPYAHLTASTCARLPTHSSISCFSFHNDKLTTVQGFSSDVDARSKPGDRPDLLSMRRNFIIAIRAVIGFLNARRVTTSTGDADPHSPRSSTGKNDGSKRHGANSHRPTDQLPQNWFGCAQRPSTNAPDAHARQNRH